MFQGKGIYIIPSVSRQIADFLRSSKLVCVTDLFYSTHTYKGFLSKGEAVWAERHSISFCKDNNLVCVPAMERVLASLIKVLSAQRQSIASGFVKPSAEL